MMWILILFSLLTKYASTQVCETCQGLVKEFHVGLKASEKGNFGGGNTAWEEERLGSFATSETRLVHIVEGLCPSTISNKEKCHYMREELEEHIEKWWFQIFRKNNDADTLYQYLCVDHLQACCPNNHYGEKCGICYQYDNETAVLCSGHGRCDGNGTRDGNGTCICDEAYAGESCGECAKDHYRAERDKCAKCHKACSQCTGPLASECDFCAPGWIERDGTCVDVDECHTNNGTLCSEQHFCNNEEGSYQCVSCDKACATCRGHGSENCISCNQGYQSVASICEDINECSADSQICRGQGQKCSNTAGSYVCDCADQFLKQPDGSCRPVVATTASSKQHLSSSNNDKNSKHTHSTKSKNKRQTKKIWTKKFEREFLKLVVGIVLLGLVSYFLGRYSVVVVVAALGCGYFVYHKSIKLDQIFSKSFYV